MSLNCYVSEKISMYHCLIISVSFYIGSRLLFNIIIYLKAYRRLPEFSGLRGKVYPGQLKPRQPIPEPRIPSGGSQFSHKWDLNGFSGTENNGHLIPPEIILVEPVE